MQPVVITHLKLGLGVSVVGIALCCFGCATSPDASRGMVAGDGGSRPWWMQETAITTDGKLDLASKPWWSRAAKLRVGEQFVIDTRGEAAGRMLVRREKFPVRDKKRGLVEGIVWVIDDDEDGSIYQGGDKDSDCYVADWDGDGVVDRMVDYIDNDDDNDPDEMDIRYFVDGALRQVWCGQDLDDDGVMWSLRGYEYGGPSFFESDPYGDSMIYMNKFNPNSGTWIPISECPFAFYDTDGDGYSEVVIRASSVPLHYDANTDSDYANDSRRYRGEWSRDMERMGIVNIRYSFDVDDLSSKAMPLHYEMGFNLVGATPYEFPDMDHFNPKRRPPQVTRVVPHDRLRAIADRFEARQTGFTWHEQHDDTISIGYGPQKDQDYRWEGVFWTWQRRFMENTGGPDQMWNVRREFNPHPTKHRDLYFSRVDRRIHLVGAQEGWIQIGHFGGLDDLGEIRMFDTDDNGFFDRWEVYLGDGPVPVRVSTVRDEKVQLCPSGHKELSQLYMQTVLPEAMAANTRLMTAMSKVRAFSIPEQLQAATRKHSLNHRRFAQDVARELQYQDLRQHFEQLARRTIAQADRWDIRSMEANKLRNTANSQTAWQLIRMLQKLDVAYGEGDYERAGEILGEIGKVKEIWQE